ncbi:MAG TPA: phage protease [Sideroxyarcus sp.]|nr:phage protease [Sideroxyarcus sp.]
MSKPRRIMLEAPGLDGLRRFVTELPKTLSLDGDTPTTWVTVTKLGHFFDPRYGEFDITREMVLAMIDNFNKNTYGQDIFLDVAHEPSKGAAGRFMKLALEGTKLRALIEWTPYGIDAVKNRGFKYLSADYTENYTDNEKRLKHGPLLFGAGLTIRPVIKGNDPVQLSEPDGSPPTFLHPELQTTLLQEIETMWKELLKQLSEKLKSFNLSEAVVGSLVAAAEKALASTTEEAAAKALIGHFEASGKQLAESIGSNPANITLSMQSSGLSAEDVRKLLAEESLRHANAAKKLAEDKAANLKLLTDAVNAATGLDEATKKVLCDDVSDLITADMSADQVKRLAENQIKQGNKEAAAKQLAALGYSRPAGHVHISVDSSNEIKSLQEEVNKRLGIARLPDSRRFSNTGGQLQQVNKELAENVLAAFDVQHGAQLHREYKMLAAGDGLVSDVAVPAIYERTVITEALYNMAGLNFVDVGTLPFAASALIPYSYRDTTGASRDSTRVYEGGAIPRAGVKQTSETAYPIPQKIAFEVSDELRYLTGSGQLDWDALAENTRNAVRIIGEDSERLIFNEILQASDQYGAAAVTNEATATADGTKSIFCLDHFPVVRPKTVYDLQGNAVGSTLYPVVVKSNNVAITAYDGTGTQTPGLYYTMDYNLGEVHFVDQTGAASAPTATHAIVASYTYASNVYAFDTDLGSTAADVHWDTFLYRYGLRKNVIESDRYHMANFGLMSGTIRTQIEQARSFIESGARNGTALDAEGNLGTVKNVPNFRTTAPGLYMGDQRIVIGERGQTRFRMMKGWTMGQLQDQRDSNGRFTGKKEAYGDQFIVLHTPTQLKAAYTSMVLYSATARVDR